MASGHWILLGEVHVRCDRQTLGDPFLVAQCLRRLYDVASFIPDCEQDDLYRVPCECHFAPMTRRPWAYQRPLPDRVVLC